MLFSRPVYERVPLGKNTSGGKTFLDLAEIADFPENQLGTTLGGAENN